MSPVDILLSSAMPLAACAFAGAAGRIDWQERRIPNMLVLSGVATGLAGQMWWGGSPGLFTAAGGVVLGAALLLPFHAVGGMGAGDVKLMGMVGAFLGPAGVLSAAVLTFLSGGLLGLAFALRRRSLVRTAGDPEPALAGAAQAPPGGSNAPGPGVWDTNRLPYAVAIASGTALHAGLLAMGVTIF